MHNNSIRKVHVVFKTHLDVGFTDFASRVIDRYCRDFIPTAIALAEQTRDRSDGVRFIWTTGSWLIDEYLRRAEDEQRDRMVAAIRRGDIAWHGLPFTTHSELLDPNLLRFGLSISANLDKRFGRKTIAAKMTDVPGHTRALLPFLAEAGITFLHIGVNAASTVPDVPEAFVWREPAGTEVMVVYSGGGYGRLHLIPGLDEALLMAHTDDNVGPPTVEAVEAIFHRASRDFPNAQIVASTMDNFALALDRVREDLPVVTAEIGDTWIHGAATDPRKISEYRELLRLATDWRSNDATDTTPPGFYRNLLLVAEHTWGLDIKRHLADFEQWGRSQFEIGRKTEPFRRMESSWKEQRAYVSDAVAALDAPQRAAAERAIAALQPQPELPPELVPFDPLDGLTHRQQHVRFDPDTGALIAWHVDDRAIAGCDADHPIGLFRYQSFDQVDTERWLQQYNVNLEQTGEWAIPDFGKPGLDAAIPPAQSKHFFPILQESLYASSEAGLRIHLQLTMPEEAVRNLGAPAALAISYTLHSAGADITLSWTGKAANRLPEASWFSFVFGVPEPRRWRMDKLDQWISPLDVVSKGARSLHALHTGMQYDDGAHLLALESLDAPLVSMGTPTLLRFDNLLPDLAGGFHVNLHNNIWGTNFPLWYEDDARFRFRIRHGQSVQAPAER